MIDEKKLIERFKQLKGIDSLANMFISDVIREIKKQPKVGEWIPCSEKLPELHRQDLDSEGEYIMISNSVIVTDGEDISVSQYEIDDADDKGWLNNGLLEDVDVIAWMPLPEPYRPGKEINHDNR